MKKLPTTTLILGLLCYATVGFPHEYVERQDGFTDGFGYGFEEEIGGFRFAVSLDFDVPARFICQRFEYRDISFMFVTLTDKETVRSCLLRNRSSFTHDDAWAIRCKAKKLVEGGVCDMMNAHVTSGYCSECGHRPYKYCPECGEKLK